MNYEETTLANVFSAVGIVIESKPEHRTEMERSLVQRWGAGDAQWKVGQCKICGGVIKEPKQRVEVLGEEVEFVFGCCNNCTAVRDAHYDRSNLSAPSTRTPNWDEQCPELYKELLGDLPASIDKPALERVSAWRPSKYARGMIITGNSGRGKTTALWALYRGLELGETNPVFLTAVELQRQLSEAARDIKGVKHLTHCRVLMVDDLGKEKLTASVAALLWEVIDSRYANRRPMVITTRYAGAAFEERFGDGVLGRDIRRRLKDCCDVVQFKGLDTGNEGGVGGGEEE